MDLKWATSAAVSWAYWELRVTPALGEREVRASDVWRWRCSGGEEGEQAGDGMRCMSGRRTLALVAEEEGEAGRCQRHLRRLAAVVLMGRSGSEAHC